MQNNSTREDLFEMYNFYQEVNTERRVSRGAHFSKYTI
jgi:hypothetical protein